MNLSKFDFGALSRRMRGACGLRAGWAEPDLADFPITWQALPALLTPAEAEAPGAPLIHGTRAQNPLIEGVVRRGDEAAALAASAHLVEGSFETAYVDHAYIEPEAGVAWMEGDMLVIRACTQAPGMDREDTAAVLDLPLARGRIIPSAVGGGFGSKLDLSLQPLIGLVALKTGRPARMIYSRGESMASTTKRHPAEMKGRIGCDGEGRITADEFEGRYNTGAYSSWGPTVANRVPVHVAGPYSKKNWGAGLVLFGGYTAPSFHAPAPNAQNLFQNWISYCATSAQGAPLNYVWQPGGATTQSFTAPATGVYTVTVTQGSCSSTGTISVTINANPVVTANPATVSVCSGGTVTVSGGGDPGVTYSWSGGITDGVAFTPVATTTYTVTGTNGAGCTATATAVVTVNPVLAGTGSASPSAICLGG